MKINLLRKTGGRFGALQFQGKLAHFEKYIEDEINTFCKTGGVFNDIYITLAYPPLYMLPGVLTMYDGFMHWYQQLPTSRVERNYSRIQVTLQAPEFAEHFDGPDQKNYEHRYEIEVKYYGLSDIDLAKALIDHCATVFKIVKKKIKPADDLDIQCIISTLQAIKPNVTESLLIRNRDAKENIEAEIRANKINKSRLKRKSKGGTPNEIIRDFRVYYPTLPKKSLYPYAYIYSEIFLNQLRESKLLCPDYHHLYIQIVDTTSPMSAHKTATENWHEYGTATIDYEKFRNSHHDDQRRMVLESIYEGLLDIAKLDGLDMEIITSVIGKINQNGIAMELTHREKESNRYKVEIKYFVKSLEEGCPVSMYVTRKSSGEVYCTSLGRMNLMELRLQLQRLQILVKKIIINASRSTMADVVLGSKPRKLEFYFDELFCKVNRLN